MKWNAPLIEGTFLKRYKRFFADVQLGNETVVAHVANTGSLKSCLREGAKALLSPAANPERKLRFSLEALQAPDNSWIGVNTSIPNSLIKSAFVEKLIPDWLQFDDIKMEHKISKETRLDGVLLKKGKPVRFFEIKNVTMADGDLRSQKGRALFPDAVTERGQKHLRELIRLVQEGFEAEIIYVIQRSDCASFSPAREIDPVYADLLKMAQDQGVLIRPLVARVTESGIEIDAKIEIILKDLN